MLLKTKEPLKKNQSQHKKKFGTNYNPKQRFKKYTNTMVNFLKKSIFQIENFLNTKVVKTLMDTTILKRVIQEQEAEREKLFKTQTIIEREVGKEKVLKALKAPNIVTILGVRRCGKSVFSMSVLKNFKKGYVNFDDELLHGMKAYDLNFVLKAFYELYGDVEYIILDELQNIEGWELFANRLRRTKKLIITGSNSKLLAGELATHLTGRHLDLILLPFSFREFLNLKKEDLKKIENTKFTTLTQARMEKLLEEYILTGGFPEAYTIQKNIVKTIFTDIITKDVMRRHNIKNPQVIEDLARYLLSNFSGEISYNKLKNVLGIKKISTIKKYVGFLLDVYILFTLERFSFKIKQRIIAPKKIYCIDTGMASNFAEKNMGKLIENLVAIELFRRKNYSQTNTEIFYWKDHYQREVDFIVKEEKVKQLIQVCYQITEKSKKRGVEALIKSSEDLRCTNLLVITWDYEGEEKIKGKKITFTPLWKWLLFL